MNHGSWPNAAQPAEAAPESVSRKSPDELKLMREAGRIVCEVLDALEQACVSGTTTWELDRLAADLTAKRKAKPAFKGYLGFPATLCASINQQVVHGIPSKKAVIAEGDLVKLDFGVSYKGWFGDSARTVAVGQVTAGARALVQTTRDSLQAGIAAAVVGARVGDIGHAVQGYAEARGCSVVRDLSGHGIGRHLHEDPRVYNFGLPNTGLKLQPGMTLAIEPMINAGTWKVDELDDGWTIVTLDGALSAHFEHTIVITPDGPEVLTRA